MTDLAGALANADGLTPFEGLTVIRTTVAIKGAGDGLSKAMKVDPAEYHQGDRLYVVLECDVSEVKFVPLDKGDARGPQVRVHSLQAGTATVMDADVVADAIADQAERIRVATEAAKGIVPLGFDEDDPTGGSDDPDTESE